MKKVRFPVRIWTATPLAALLSLVGGPASAQSAGQMHVLAVTENVTADGDQLGGIGLRHAIRLTNGSWTRFGDVEAAAGEIGEVASAEAAMFQGSTDLHVVAVNQSGTLFHTIRRGDGSWLHFGNLSAVLGIPGGALGHSKVGMTSSILGVHVCTTTSNGGLWHTIRNANGSWLPWENVMQKTATNIGSASWVDCAVQNSLLQITVVANGKVWHATRTISANPTWSALGNVTAAAQLTGIPSYISCTRSNSGLNIIDLTFPAGGGQATLRTAIRFDNGSWQPFSVVPGNLISPGPASITTAITWELHVVALNGLRLVHNIRTSGTWGSWGDVGAATGSTEPFHSVSVAAEATQTIP